MFLLWMSIIVVFGVCNAIPLQGPERHQVIVVGAGVAGFTAATTLLEHNITDVLVLEASDRIGGRTHTVQFGGVTIDKGAEFVHGQEGNAVYELVYPHDLLVSYNTVRQANQTLYVNMSGYEYDSNEADAIFEAGMQILYEEGEENILFLDNFYRRYEKLVQTKNVSRPLAEGILHAILLEEGVYSGLGDLKLLGHSQFAGYRTCGGDLNLKWKTGGYKLLYDIITKKYPNASETLPVADKILLGKQMTRVERREGEVEVSCADGSTYLADHVIVTVSLGVLKKHAATMFHPALPPEKSAAIEKLGIDCVGKVFILFPERWWPANITGFIPVLSEDEKKQYVANSTYGYWTVNTSTFSPVMVHDRMLCAWYSGQDCRTMESLSDQQVVDGLTEYFKALVGSKYNVTTPEAVLRTSWWSNPYTLGSYSYRTPEGDAANITGAVLAEPVLHGDKPVLMFGGEATHPYYFSTVHGALETGRREARRIIDYHKARHNT